MEQDDVRGPIIKTHLIKLIHLTMAMEKTTCKLWEINLSKEVEFVEIHIYVE
jgi:hypothetical protein